MERVGGDLGPGFARDASDEPAPKEVRACGRKIATLKQPNKRVQNYWLYYEDERNLSAYLRRTHLADRLTNRNGEVKVVQVGQGGSLKPPQIALLLFSRFL